MKLTKQKLEQLITENLQNYQAEQFAKRLGKQHAKSGMEIKSDEDIQNNYGNVFNKKFPGLESKRYEALYIDSFEDHGGELNIPDPMGGEVAISPDQPDDLI
jgi:hypothetical protein